MFNLKPALASAVLFGAISAVGCGGYAYYGYRVAPPPPPPVEVGVMGYAPGPGYVWIGGFYDLRGDRWEWRRGYWAQPPRPRAVWVRPYWERHGHGYRFHRGYWR
jgi:hypothetical protein